MVFYCLGSDLLGHVNFSCLPLVGYLSLSAMRMILTVSPLGEVITKLSIAYRLQCWQLTRSGSEHIVSYRMTTDKLIYMRID